MGMTRKQISLWGPHENPAKRFSWGEEEGMERAQSSPKAGTEQSGISSDESQDALKRHYPHNDTGQDPQFFKRAYKDIRRFMEANGFERRQYSVYVSADQRTSLDVALLAQRMGEALPWLRLCVKDITVTNIGARHNYGAPNATQRSGCGGERRKEWSGWSPRCQAGTEQSGISSDEGLLRSDALSAELLPPASKSLQKKRKMPER